MKTKNVAGVLAATAALAALGTGQAHADGAAFQTPFVDPGCLCAGVLPGAVQKIPAPVGPGTTYTSGHGTTTIASVTFWPVESVPSLDRMAQVWNDKGTGAWVEYHGERALLIAYVSEEGGIQGRSIAFVHGNHMFELDSAAPTAEDATANLNTLESTFQFL